jgi:hypothetical protein
VTKTTTTVTRSSTSPTRIAEAEKCDGLDNDGDEDVDEDFDSAPRAATVPESAW